MSTNYAVALIFSVIPAALFASLQDTSQDPALIQDEITVKLQEGETKIPLWILKPSKIDKKKKYPAIISLPTGPGTREAVHFVHNRFWKKEAPKRNYFIINMEIPGLKFANNIEDSKKLTDSILNFINKKIPAIDLSKCFIAGASNGGTGALTTFILNSTKFAGCVVFPGALDGNFVNQDKEAVSPDRLKDKQIYMIVGEKDEDWKRTNDQVVEVAKSKGMKVKYEVIKNGEHIPDIKPSVIFDWADEVIKEIDKKKQNEKDNKNNKKS
ncbi:MAG: hypothetical protein HY606_10285 [Planctomycetes bacterium]|nr:hypothetical protein [Planctomycetota bacterium]